MEHLGASERGGRRTIAHSLYARDVSAGDPKLLYHGEAPERGDLAPRFKFSPTADRLLVLLSSLIFEGEGDESHSVGQESRLLLIDVESAETREVATADRFGLASFCKCLWQSPWSPDGDSFIYEIGNTVYLGSVTGERRELLTLAEDDPVSRMSSFGWSPDGRYVGISCASWGYPDDLCKRSSILVLDVEAGEIRTVVEGEGVLFGPRWLRR